MVLVPFKRSHILHGFYFSLNVSYALCLIPDELIYTWNENAVDGSDVGISGGSIVVPAPLYFRSNRKVSLCFLKIYYPSDVGVAKQ